MEFLLTALSYTFLFVVACSLFVLGGISGILKYIDILVLSHSWKKNHANLHLRHAIIKQKLAKESRNFKSDNRLSGSSVIDDELQDFIHLSLRDFIENWYSAISDNKEFIYESRKALRSTFIMISSKCKEVDWLNDFLPKVMDVLATHIRLYKSPVTQLVQVKPHESVKEYADHLTDQTKVSEQFFELDSSGICKIKYTRRKIFEDKELEKDTLKVIGDAILWLASPVFEFKNRPLELLASQILVGGIILPNLASTVDPDYLNQLVIWMCAAVNSGGDSLVSVLRSTALSEELEAVADLLNKELNALRSNDLGCNEANELNKRQVSSLLFLKEIIEKKLENEFHGTCSVDLGITAKNSHQASPYTMSLDEILRNSISLSYFLDFLSSRELQGFLLFLLSIEGWKCSIIQEPVVGMSLSSGVNGDVDLMKEKSGEESFTNIFKEAAQNIVEQYLSPCVTNPIDVDESLTVAVQDKLRSGDFDESLFEDVKNGILEKFQNEERFLVSFYRSDAYMQMLAELELGKHFAKPDKLNAPETDPVRGNRKASSESNRAEESTVIQEGIICKTNPSASCEKATISRNQYITAQIIDKGIYRDKFGSHVVYSVLVRLFNNGKEIDQWVACRRYSDFYEFHSRLGQKCKVFCSFPFPAKRAFNNMDREFLEMRKKHLNEYLRRLTEERLISTLPELPALLLDFLRKDSEPQKTRIFRKVDNFVTPLLSSLRTKSRTVRSGPLEKDIQFQQPGQKPFKMSPFAIPESDEVAFSLGAEQMAVRILLFLMDEIFDLRYRNQWLRRTALLMLREILQAMYGDVFDEKINELLVSLTSASQLADNIRSIKNKIWPAGVFYYVPPPLRTNNTKMRTRVAAKTMLISCISDEIKHLIGNETTRLGIIQTFDLFQNSLLNRRLVYILAETVLTTLFPNNKLSYLFLKLHYIPKEV